MIFIFKSYRLKLKIVEGVKRSSISQKSNFLSNHDIKKFDTVNRRKNNLLLLEQKKLKCETYIKLCIHSAIDIKFKSKNILKRCIFNQKIIFFPWRSEKITLVKLVVLYFFLIGKLIIMLVTLNILLILKII